MAAAADGASGALAADEARREAAELQGTLGPGHRVLCFGDSLTAGFSEGGASFYPWANQLWAATGCDAAEVIGVSSGTANELLASAAKQQVVDTCGRGWPGLARQLDDATRRGAPFTVVVIMLGTNDLNHPLSAENSPEFVVASVSGLHRICHDRGVRTVGVAIPPNKFSSAPPGDDYADRWRRANELVKGWVHETDAAAFCEFPFGYADPAANGGVAAYWGDDFHLSKEGYAEFARRLAERLAPSRPPAAADPERKSSTTSS